MSERNIKTLGVVVLTVIACLVVLRVSVDIRHCDFNGEYCDRCGKEPILMPPPESIIVP